MAWLATSATRAVMPYGILAFAVLGLLPVVLVLATIGAHVYLISLAVKLPVLLPGRSTAGAGRPATHAARSV